MRPTRPDALPCGCLTGPAVLLVPRCREADRLWEALAALQDRATSSTPEWEAYRAHFARERR